MEIREMGLAFVVALGTVATPAKAGEWWLVFLGGEKPARLVIAVDEDYINPYGFGPGVYKLETLAVLENEKLPDWITSNVIVDCAAQTIEEKLIQISPRGGPLQRAPDQPARLPKDAVERQLLEFGCEMGSKKDAERVALRLIDNTGRGLLYLGGFTIEGIADLTWKAIWPDGTRPPHNETRTPEEMERDFNNSITRIDQIITLTRAMAGQIIEDDKAVTEQLRRRRGQ
ncbi:hypothetical protein [[Pseudomonas] boreopolis]|uniref:hypothetical protein n=1 Tax=Xanthomonas boreopolis TaxID=86183 RepID=UPI003D9AE462